MKSERLGHSLSSRSSLSGSNDDSSVVSLKALVAKADPTLGAARSTTSEDSGLIDLKKLMASAPPASEALPTVLAPSEAGLFDVPEITLMPHVAVVLDASNEASAPTSHRWAKWAGAAALVTVVAVGLMGILHSQKADVSAVQSSAAAAAPVAPIETNRFVEEPRPVETAPVPVVANVAPVETAAPPPKTTTQPSRKAAVQTPSRNQAQQETTPRKVESTQPPPPPCDLMCEIQRAAKKKKQ